jgi:hypothetical protein
MRLILVHGINQQARTSADIQESWLATLRRAAERPATWPQDRLTRIDTPFYGDRLFALTETPVERNAVAQGADEASDDFAAFAEEAFAEMAVRIGATREQIDQEAGEIIVSQGAGVHKKWLKAVARVIERVSPFKGTVALRLLAQAHAYLKRPHVSIEVDDIVRPAFEDEEPAIIVAHSLGTIVTFKLLRKFEADGRPRNCPLYTTLGSPLGIDVVRKSFAKPRKRPADITRWLNGADPDDFVALRPLLSPEIFGAGIENVSDIDNGYDDPHSITQYLSDHRIAEAIASAIDAA